MKFELSSVAQLDKDTVTGLSWSNGLWHITVRCTKRWMKDGLSSGKYHEAGAEIVLRGDDFTVNDWLPRIRLTSFDVARLLALWIVGRLNRLSIHQDADIEWRELLRRMSGENLEGKYFVRVDTDSLSKLMPLKGGSCPS